MICGQLEESRHRRDFDEEYGGKKEAEPVSAAALAGGWFYLDGVSTQTCPAIVDSVSNLLTKSANL